MVKYFVECSSIWICLMCIIKLRLCIIGENTKEVMCPSQDIISGVYDIELKWLITAYVNLDHLIKEISPRYSLYFPIVISHYLGRDTLRLCIFLFLFKHSPTNFSTSRWILDGKSLLLCWPNDDFCFIPSTFITWNSLEKNYCLSPIYLFIPPVIYFCQCGLIDIYSVGFNTV